MALTTRQRQKVLRIMVWIIPVIIILTIAIAWIFFYPEKYDIFYESISALGGIYSGDAHLPNPKGVITYNIGFGLCAAYCTTIAIIYFFRKELDSNYIKGSFLLVMGLGAVGIALPHDNSSLSFFHFLGAFTFITAFGIYNFLTQTFRFIRKHRPKKANKDADYYLDFVIVCILLADILFYFVVVILEELVGIDIPGLNHPTGQKVVLLLGTISTYFLDPSDM
jgi:hypothetical protein